MTMREKIVSMKDDDIKAGVEEAKELEAENAPCTIAVLLFSKMLAVSLTQRVATESCLYKKETRIGAAAARQCERLFIAAVSTAMHPSFESEHARYHTPPGHCDCSGGGRLLVW